jgi:23S rRNA pseudouridine955/2504/2580 synthase
VVTILKNKISEEDDGIRVDRWFQRHHNQYSFAHVSKLARTGQLRINGKRVKASDRVLAGQEIRFPNLIDEHAIMQSNNAKAFQSTRYSDLRDSMIDSVLYMDSHILVINKPSGLAVQGGNGIEVSVDDLSIELQFDAKEKPKLVHRIDKETSGILVLARSAKAAQKIADSFKNREVKKKYLAILQGVPKPLKGIIDQPLAKVDDGAGFENMAVTMNGQEAITKYKVLMHNKNIALVEFEPITGRKHQIRAHAAHIECPIIGDRKYNKQISEYPKFRNILCLHSNYINLEIFGEKISIEAPLPEYFKSILKIFELNY